VVALLLLVLVLLAAVSPVYRDVFLDTRDRWRGASFADFAGHLEYDRRLLHDFSWGGWHWNPDKAFGIPRFLELNNRPLYPVPYLLLAFLPALAAWHWLTVFHVVLRALGLVLLCRSLYWPPWLVVAAAAAAMLAEGTLGDFNDVLEMATGSWVPLLAWLTVEAARRERWSGWDSAWVIAAAVSVTGSQMNFVMYYHVLLGCIAVSLSWGRLRRDAPRLLGRYALLALVLAPLLVPALSLYRESGRAHYVEFGDWHLRRAFSFWNNWVRWSDFRASILEPRAAWLALVPLLALARGRAGPLTYAFGAYLALALLHAVRYAPLWFLGALAPGLRLPQRIFEPLPWLIALPLAEATYAALRTRWRGAAVALFAVAVGWIAWAPSLDPHTAYVWPRWTRPLPEQLAATIRAEPRAAVLPLTGPERAPDAAEPVMNSNHHFFLGLPGAHFFGEIPTYPFLRAAYRVPGLVFMQRMATPIGDWEPVVDVYAELGIRWIIWDGDTEPVHPRLRAAGEDQGFRLYEIRGARPLVYAPVGLRSVARPARPSEVASLIYTLPSLGPFCYDCPTGGAAGAARVDWRWSAGAVRAVVESPQGAYVVLGETYSPGWRATLDGAATRSYQVNEMFQAVWAPPGRHEIAWRYHDPRFAWGVALGLLGLAVCVALPLRSRNPRW
jgi:hypothetical protein